MPLNFILTQAPPRPTAEVQKHTYMMPVPSAAASKTDKPHYVRKRAKHTRSKLGCGVCRIRRVRCDRVRPSCDRCTKTGRTCDGYPLGASPTDDDKTQSSVSLTPVSKSFIPPIAPLQSLDTQRHRSFRYFQSKTAIEFAGYFHNDLWSTVVLQISHREECVRHVVIALGLLHESFHLTNSKPSNLPHALVLREQAISQYVRGVSLLNSHIEAQGWQELEVTLLCSILCVAFEWLRVDYVSARRHLRSTLSIITQWHSEDTFIPRRTSFWSPSGHLIRKRLKPICVSLVLQARTMPTDAAAMVDLPLHLHPEIQPFSNLQDARITFDITLASLLVDTVGNQAKPLTTQQQATFAIRLSRWSRYFDDYLATTTLDDSAALQVTIMKLWLVTARILFTAALAKDECHFDVYTPEFQHIVDSIETILSSMPSYFSLDIGVLPLLSCVGLKCRQPDIRRRAIALLADTPRREAAWGSLAAAHIAGQVMNVEEAGLGQISSAGDIPGLARVCSMHVVPEVDRRRIRMKTKQQGDLDWGPEKVFVW